MTNGKRPSSGRADLLEDRLRPAKISLQQDDQEARDAEHQRDGARVAAQLA